MQNLGQILKVKREEKEITLKKAAADLRIKEYVLRSIEEEEWNNLPEPIFVAGFIKNYANYLGVDSKRALAFYRRGFDEKKYPRKKNPLGKSKNPLLTPKRFINLTFGLFIFLFVLYLAIQYFSILSAPKLEIISPENDLQTAVPKVQIQGKTEKNSTVSVNGEFAAVDENGNFSKEVSLKEGKNTITIIASKKLSPKTEVSRVIRLNP